MYRMGFHSSPSPSWLNMAPRLMLEASVSRVKGFSKSGAFKMGSVVNTLFSWSKVLGTPSDGIGVLFLEAFT